MYSHTTPKEVTQDTADQMNLVRAAAMVLEKQLTDSCKDSRETSLAFTKLEETVMWAIRSLAINGHEVQEQK